MSLALAFDHVTLTRGMRVLVQDMSLTLRAGQVLTLHGDNGSGKTSMLRAAAGLLRPFSGKIHRDASVTMRFLGHELALKPQDTAAQILDAAALAAWNLQSLQDLPLGLLSAGQRKRVALAQRCRPGAQLWLFDEPLANLDAAQADVFQNVLAAHLDQGGCALISAHGAAFEGPVLTISKGRAHVA